MGEAGQAVRWVARSVECLVWGTATALLPSPRREAIARARGVSAARSSAWFGLVQGAIGLFLYMMGYLMFIGAYGAHHQWLLLENWTADLDLATMQSAGIFGFIAWHMLPHAWVFMYLALVGLVRCVTFLAVQEPVAEPVVALVLWIVGATRHKRAVKSRADKLGPSRPDRVIRDPRGEDCDLIVVSSRDKPHWNERITIEIEEGYYRLLRREDRWEEERMVVCFFLAERGEHEVMRGFTSWGDDPLHPDNYREPSAH